MKNILITGGFGFIGSELVNISFGYINTIENLVVLDKIDYCSRENNISPHVRNDPRFSFIKGNLCDYDLIKSILEKYSIDIVIHMAAQSHVDKSFNNPIQFTTDNIVGTHTLLEVCRKYNKLQKFIHMSTDEVYGEVSHDETQPCNEDSMLNPTNPYSATKACAEIIVKTYGHSYNFPYIIIRGNNVYGHGQFPDKLISKFILHLHLGNKVTIHGDGQSQRSFVYVTDMAEGILTIAQKGELRQVYNIGSSNEYSVLEITKLLCNLMNKDYENSISYVSDRCFNDKRYFINYDKISELGWKERVPFIDGLTSTIKWYIDHSNEYESLTFFRTL